MKKSIVIVILMAFCALNIKAEPVFSKGGTFLSGGVGIGSPYAFSNLAIVVPPISGRLDFGLTDNLSLGLLIGFQSITVPVITTYPINYLMIAPRIAYHIDPGIDKLDAYAGASVGYLAVSSGAHNTEIKGANGVYLGLYVGGTYMFTPKFGAFGELGYSFSWITLGLTLKI